jgi:tripartite ATP-independent transporter DctM subunit
MMNVDVSDLFMGAIFPGLLLVSLYMVYIWVRVLVNPNCAPAVEQTKSTPIPVAKIVQHLAPPLILMIIVLGTILLGMASPTEASACGAMGALIITSLKGKMSLKLLKSILERTVHMTTMVFTILIGAQFFGVVFRGLKGDEVIQNLILESNIPPAGVLLFVMILMFVMGFFLDFIEICFIIIPVVSPILIKVCGLDPLWVAILMAINLQTSFLTPPFGFALFYLKGVAPPDIKTMHLYKGILPFVFIQILAIVLIATFPDIVTWLPRALNP